MNYVIKLGNTAHPDTLICSTTPPCPSKSAPTTNRSFLFSPSLPPLPQTMSILEERLTTTENKVRECLDSQQRISLQIQPHD